MMPQPTTNDTPKHNCHQSTLPSTYHKKPTKPAMFGTKDSPDHLPNRHREHQLQSSVSATRSMKHRHCCSPRLLLMFTIVAIQEGGETFATATTTITIYTSLDICSHLSDSNSPAQPGPEPHTGTEKSPDEQLPIP
ncbi:hypothetical protein M0R45_001851 [Rubus argutus]|uniref:Uncharacterized protein n=1 Tax=Rubus argutus TaxID=59490 RepID=A0AAW1VKP8_RUBAR